MSTPQPIDTDISSGIAADTDQYLTFILAGEEYGVDILRVQEIKGWGPATPIPNTPDYIKGVINLRGTIVPIVDLRRRFDLEPMEYGPMTVVIVLRVEAEDKHRIMGIVVDAVSDVYNIGDDGLKPPPDFGSVIDIDFVRGLATVDEKMVIVLDIDHLLARGVLHAVEKAAR
jgi:purine-binding chemotaxis protein CheW